MAKFEHGDMTVGDVNVPVTLSADEVLTGKNVDFEFIKPSGKSIRRDATVTGTYTARYLTVSGDIDESGEWRVFAKDAGSGYYYTKESGNIFRVRPKPMTMANS